MPHVPCPECEMPDECLAGCPSRLADRIEEQLSRLDREFVGTGVADAAEKVLNGLAGLLRRHQNNRRFVESTLQTAVVVVTNWTFYNHRAGTPTRAPMHQRVQAVVANVLSRVLA